VIFPITTSATRERGPLHRQPASAIISFGILTQVTPDRQPISPIITSGIATAETNRRTCIMA
jgi:hypothetical protein